MSIQHLLTKLPEVRGWILKTLEEHQALARPVASYGFTRLPQFYSADTLFAGLLQTHTDGHGVGCTKGYDSFLRSTTNSYSSPLSEHNMVTLRQYDARGLLTQVSEGFVQGNMGAAVTGGADNSVAYRAGYTALGIASLLVGGEFGQMGRLGKVSGVGEVASIAGRNATTLGLTTYDLAFVGTGNRFLDAVGIRNAEISNIKIALSPSLFGADLANAAAHEGLHASIAQNLPNFAASSGRLPYFGAFPLYAEEVAAYAYGGFSAGQYGQALLSPISAFGSLSPGQSISVLGTAAAVGGLYFYNQQTGGD